MKKTLSSLVLAACCLACQKTAPTPPDLDVTGSDPAGVTTGPLGTLHWNVDPAEMRGMLEEMVEEEAAGNEAPSESASPVTGAPAAVANRLPATEQEYGEDLRSLGYASGDDSNELTSLNGYGAGTGNRVFLDDARRAPGAGDKPDAPTTWRRAGAAVNATTLRVGDEDELPLLGVECTAWVDGFRARVLMDCIYKNDREQQLEGTFKLRLPEGATPYYLAFGEEVLHDDGEWSLPERDRSREQGPEAESVLQAREAHWKGAREARLVPRGEAARAYQNTVRQNVDPALMEWAGAGVFQTRVFPLLPGAVHRVVVGYEVDLLALPGSSGEYEFHLELPEDLPALSLDLHVLAPEGADVVVEPPASSAWDSSGGVRRSHSFPATDARDFRVRLSALANTALVSSEDTGYFALDLAPQLEAAGGSGAPYAIFVVDSSLSSAGGGFETWLELMQAILENNRDHLSQFAVLFFDVTPRWWKPNLTHNTASAVADLREYAESLALEGASDLGAALEEAARPGWLGLYDGPSWDLFLLSDGAATWGEQGSYALSAKLRKGIAGALFAYSTGRSGTDRRMLEHLARESGGALFTVNGPADVAAASTAHHGRPWRIEDLRVPGGNDLLLRGRPTAIFPGQRMRLVGRGAPRVGDTLELVLEQGGRRNTFSWKLAHALETPLAARAYGEVATVQLEELGRTTRGEAQAFATRFRVPGKACSLLMLESEEDYLAQGFLPEEEIAIARGTEAAPLVAAALDALSGLLEDPARAILELLEPLARGGLLGAARSDLERLRELGYAGDDNSPATTLLLDPELVAHLARLPEEALRVRSEPLAYEALRADTVPAAITTELAGGKPAYDAVQEEAARRLAELELGDAVRMLSCLVELNPGDAVFVRDVAQTLMQWDLFGHAYHLYLRVAEARPFEPQSFLSLARCAEESGQGDLALTWYTVALQGSWDPRFGDFHRIAAFDALHFLRRSGRETISPGFQEWALQQLPAITEAVNLARADLAIAIQWNTDATDIDLHVVEPSGEHCYYSHPDTELGAHLSQDVTQGYGPELYVLPRATDGQFAVWVHYFSGDPSKTAVRTKILATVYQRWGSPDEVVERREILLEQAQQDQGIVVLDVER